MNERQIIGMALENLERQTQIKGKWELLPEKKVDGRIILNIGNQKEAFHIECKKELRTHQLQQLIDLNGQFNPVMLIAIHLFPKIKEELRKNNIAYLEANGNIFLKNKRAYVWIDVNEPLANKLDTGNRAFTKTGLKVVFQFLINETWIQKPYRETGAKLETGIGNITNIIKGLKKQGYLLPTKKNKYILHKKDELIDKWAKSYDVNLKPNILVGTFRFLNEETFTDWKEVNLRKGKTCWGGEPAADFLTNYLRPGELTLYTTETRNELIKNYKLIPDDKGNIKVFEKFWKDENTNLKVENKDNIAPPLLVYADLMNTNDRRCAETAQKIYEQYLQT